MPRKIKVGIIGCGTIGSEVARACQSRLKDRVRLVAICDTDEKRTSVLKRSLSGKPKIMKMGELIDRVDLVVESASAKISPDVLARCVEKRRDCLIMSVGGLIERRGILERAEKKGVKVYIPSGAICGLDGLKSSATGRIDSVTLTTRKPPRGLEGAPYLKERGIDVSAIKDETMIFEGSAEDAVKGFPQNVNVAAVLSLAGLGASRTLVRIMTAPDCAVNSHEIEVKGEFGRLLARTENVPSKTNPKTSALAIFSAIATLERIANSVKIGT